MSEKTATGFLDRLRESGIATDTAIDEISAQGPFEHEKVPARLAIEKGLVTLWQAKRLLNGNTQLKLGNYVLLERLPAPNGRNLYAAKSKADAKTYWVEWESPATSSADEITLAATADSGWAVHPIHVESLADGQAIIYPAIAGKPVFGDKKQAARLERTRLAKAIRSIAAGLGELHEQGHSWGRMHPAQLLETEDGFRLGRWGSWRGQDLNKDPFSHDELINDPQRGVDSDLISLGRLALFLGFGTTSSNKVQPKSRLDRLVMRLADSEASDRPQTAAEVVEALDQWLASKGDEDGPPVAETSAGDEGNSTPTGFPAIDTHGSGPVVLDPKKLEIHTPEFRERNMIVTYAIYSVLSLIILTSTVVAVVVVVRMQNQPEVAQNEPVEAETEPQAVDPAGGEGVLPVNPVVDNEPAPLIDLDLPGDDVGEPAGPPQVAVAAPNPEGVDIAVDPLPNVDPMPMPATPDPQPTPEKPEVVVDNNPAGPNPMPEEPYVPVFQDLPAVAELPVVGEDGWQEQVVLGTLHLRPGDLLFTELKGSSKAFRENSNFEIANADGGTAQYAFDVVSIVGGNRTRVARLDAEGGTLKFRYYDEAVDVAAANYLRNCYLRLRTGTDVGGIALRKPVELAPLSLDDRRVQAESDTTIGFLPEANFIKVRLLPLGETFPDYAFKDNVSVTKAQRGSVDIIFGGKYSEAMFLRLESQLRNRLSLKVNSFAIADRRARPFRSEEVEKTLEDATGLRDLRAAQIKQLDTVPQNQRPPTFDQQRQLFEVERKQAETLVKQCQDTLTFVDSMKGQKLPVAVFFEADEFKVYLATVDGKPLDD